MQLKIPMYFQPFTGWNDEVEVKGNSIGMVMEDLFHQFPELRTHFFTHWGILSANVLIYLNQEEIFSLQGFETPVNAGDHIRIVPTASGG